MQWIKSHLTVVICGTVALLSMVGLVMGMMNTTALDEMQTDQSLYNTLNGLQPINEKTIDSLKDGYRRNAAKLKEAIKDIEAISKHEPILPNVFPEVAARDQAAPYEFKEVFKAERLRLLSLLKAKDKPSAEEIQEENNFLQHMQQQQKLEEALGVTTGGVGDAVPGLAPTPGVQPQPFPSAGGAFTAFGGVGAAGKNEMSLEERLRTDAALRVSLRRAYEIYCYAGVDSLDPLDPLLAENTSPSVELMWYCQVRLWLQEDVLGALARLNEEAAAQLPEQDRWVGNLPVKHLGQILVGKYVPPSQGAGGFGGGGGGGGHSEIPNSASDVFTNRGSSDGVDVMQFSLSLIIEARALPAVMAAICNAGFYTPLSVTYEAVPPATDFVDYIYGSDPVIKVQMLYEGCFLRSNYEKWIPPGVAQMIADGTAGPDTTTGGRGGFGGTMGGMNFPSGFGGSPSRGSGAPSRRSSGSSRSVPGGS